jgi:hypothetical protein
MLAAMTHHHRLPELPDDGRIVAHCRGAYGTTQVLGRIPAGELSVFSAVLDRVLMRLRATYDPS